ncbi:hypothetical protein DFA_00567 [Cavenderia fasciculata]|uniref:HEAT repeat-containing protein n=1 Tax=Cavenderia fasciculata TaxID=261658 RepID=F4PSL4_CACFS|nr:uncharacterized protein DFA_00567 [Cavenderia fasciculata]EGG20706.1 hypothetical protein DFA_00567 [Cavenderia fasciculata]|eukprot:XP_004358556.1 hypothetical protein DFA_00567 [Cavenderia fasciculata]
MSLNPSTLLENYYVSLVKAVADGAKSNNLLLKFDVLSNVGVLLDRMNKTEIDSIASKWIQTLSNCLAQSTGSSLANIIGSILARLFEYPQGSKVSTSIVKVILTNIRAKTTTVPVKSSLIEVLGIICKNSKTFAILFQPDIFDLLSKHIKSGELRCQSIRALSMAVESVQAAGNSIHLEDFKVESLNTLIPVLKYYNSSDSKFHLDAFDQKILSFILKGFEDENQVCSKKSAETLGLALSILLYKDAQQSQVFAPTSAAKTNQQQQNHWTFESCLNYLGSQYVSSNKKEFKINMAISITSFLQNLKLLDLEKSVDMVLTLLVKLLSNNKSLALVNDQIYARTCISHILRHGLGEKVSENGQQLMLKFFINILSQSETLNELTVLVSLRELSYLLFDLGEGGILQAEDLSNHLFGLLVDKNQSIRQWSAICLRALVTNIPKQTSKYLSQCLQNLNQTLGEFDKPNVQPEPLKKITNSVKGHAYGISGLISSLKKSDLGVPTSLMNEITKTASSLLSNPDFLNPAITLSKLEAGWIIMNSLIKYMSVNFIESILPNLFGFWKSCFNITTIHPTAERDIVIFAKTRADALMPLHSFIVNHQKLLGSKIVASIVSFLGNTLKTVSELPAISSSFQPSTNELTQLLEANLIKAFLALPPSSYATHHTTLMTVVTSLLLDGCQNTMIPYLLSKDDEDVIQPDFTSIHYKFDSMFLVPLATQDSSITSLLNFNDCFLPKFTQNLEIRVVNNSIEQFTALFIAQPDRHRTKLLDHLANCIKECPNAQQRLIMQINSLTVIFYILKSMVSTGSNFGKSDVGSSIQRFVQKYVSEPSSALLRRIAAESLGLLCRIEGDNITAAILKTLTEIVRKPAKEVATEMRSAAGFVMGCIQRSVGAMMSQKYLPATIGNLHVLAQDNSSWEVRSYALHALYVTIQSCSGFAFNSFASPTLLLLQTLLVSDTGCPPYQQLGRIVNSIVVALGPELEHNKDVLSKCTTTCAVIEKNETPSTRVESIYYKQKLILFAPATVNESIVPYLTSQFKSPYLMLRIASITCLRQLLQKKSTIEIGIKIVDELFLMLDIENDTQLQKELKLLLNAVIDNISNNSNPSQWLNLCLNIILSSKQMTKDTVSPTNIEMSGSTSSATAPGKTVSPDEEKDEEEEDVQVVADQTKEQKIEYVYRWSTKVFAIECVRRILSVVCGGTGANSINVTANTLSLVNHLHELIGIAFKSATSQIDSMRPVGILLLRDILEYFEAYPFITKALASLIHTPFWLKGRDGKDSSTEILLKETTPIDDLYVILGLSIIPQEKFLSDPTERNLNLENMIITLDTISLVFQQPATESNNNNHLRLEDFPIERIDEICQILLRSNAFENWKIHKHIIDIIHNLFQSFGEKLIKEESIFSLLLKIIFKPIYIYAENITNKKYYQKLYNCCNYICKYMNDEQSTLYSPLFLLAILNGLSKSTDPNLMSVAIQFAISIFKNNIKDKPAIQKASLETTIEYLQSNETSQGLLLLLSTLITNKSQIEKEEIQLIVKYFNDSITSPSKSTKEKLYHLQVIRNILSSSSSHTLSQDGKPTPVYQVTSHLINGIFGSLHNVLYLPPNLVNSKQSEEIDINNEIIKIYTLSLSFIQPENKILILLPIIQLLILYLNPTLISSSTSAMVSPMITMHHSALQTLISFATSQPQFKEIVSNHLPLDQKQLLEQSIRQSVENANKKEVGLKLPSKPPQIQLAMDFSKIGNQ